MSFFDTLLETLSWANGALADLEAACNAFLDGDSIRPITEFDPKTGENVYKWKQFVPLPNIVNQRTMETLGHLKNSFDQSLFAACSHIGKTPRHSIYFPWADNPTDLEHRLRRKKSGFPIIPPELWPVLRGLEPYPRSNAYSGGHNVRALAKIANRKHTVRLTTSVVCEIAISEISIRDPLRLFVPEWDSVKNEVAIARAVPGSDFEYKGEIAFHIVFDEAAPLRDIPILLALHNFLTKAQRAAERLEREARAIVGG